MNLTESQKELLLYLGGSNEDDRVVSLDVLDELVKLGLLNKDSERHCDLTDLGEELYDRLSGRNDGW
jgi:hypothetical protein